MNLLTYREYQGRFEYDDVADLFHGDVINLADVVTFQGRSIDDLKKSFKESVDDYLVFCRRQGKEPGKPYSGRFNVRLEPELHRRIALKASQQGITINRWVAQILNIAAR